MESRCKVGVWYVIFKRCRVGYLRRYDIMGLGNEVVVHDIMLSVLGLGNLVAGEGGLVNSVVENLLVS